MKNKTKILVAVYGTLKQGEYNHGLLSGSELIGDGTTPPNYALLELGSFPGAINGNSRLMVEVYEVDERTLSRLDQLEGHPSFYERKLIPIQMDHLEGAGSGPILNAWMYVLAHQGASYKYQPMCDTLVNGRIDWRLKNRERVA